VVQVWVITDQEQVWYPHWGTTQFGFLQDWDILSVNNFGFKIAKISGCAAVGYQENSVERSSKEFGYGQIINQVGNVLPYNTYKKCTSIFLTHNKNGLSPERKLNKSLLLLQPQYLYHHLTMSLLLKQYLYNSPYYVLLDSANIPQADDENSISNLGGECIHYYCLHFAKSSFSEEFYMHYEHYLEKWITHHYKDNSSVEYEVFLHSYQRNTKTIEYIKYTFETPYNIVKIHTEHPEDDQLDIYVCVSIAIKTHDDNKALTEKTSLSDYLEDIRTIVVENNKELNNTTMTNYNKNVL